MKKDQEQGYTKDVLMGQFDTSQTKTGEQNRDQVQGYYDRKFS